MNKRKSTNDFSTILSSFLILLLVVGVVGFLFIRTENFTTPLINFYVRVGNDDIMADRDNFDIYTGKDYKFEIKTTISVLGGNTKYYVSVLPNKTPTTTFSFNVGEETKNYTDMESLAKGFSISTYEDYFIFRANMDMQDILSLYFPSQKLTNVASAVDSGLPYFTLAISSANKSETININFNLIKQINNSDGSLTITPSFVSTDGASSSGVVTFSEQTIVLTNYFNTATFTFSITENYELTSTFYNFSFYNVTINDNVCTITLTSNIYDTYSEELVFNIRYVSNDVENDSAFTFYINDNGEEYGHISFSTDKVVLSNTVREKTFTFTVDDGYDYEFNYLNDSERYLVEIHYAECTCTVKLVDGYMLSVSDTINLNFSVFSI